MDMLNDIRNSFSRVMNFVLFAHIPIVIAAGLFTGQDLVFPFVFSLVIAIVPFVVYKMHGPSDFQRQMVGVSLVLFASLFVFQFRGHPWQIDVHMYFFAVLAALAAYCDFRVIIISAGVVAVHHIGLNFIMPAWLFPQGADFGRVILHATVVILEVPSLIWIALKLNQAFFIVSKAQEEAQLQTENAKRTAEESEELRVKAEEALKNVQEKEEENQRLQIIANEEKENSIIAAQETRDKTAADYEDTVLVLLNQMTKVVDTVEANTSNLINSTEIASDKIQSVSEATQNMNDNIGTVASSIEEMTASAQEISQQVNRTTDVAESALQISLEGESALDELSKRSGEIRTVIQLINDIADQTNLLALNATIEAARAGEAGRGFSVVASEVKGLAGQSANATKEIEDLINAVTDASNSATEVNKKIVTIIDEVKQNSTGISAAVEEQTATTAETSRAAQTTSNETASVNNNANELRDIIENVRLVSEETGEAVQTLIKYNKDLREKSEAFITTLKEA